jgi:hypothetical protein
MNMDKYRAKTIVWLDRIYCKAMCRVTIKNVCPVCLAKFPIKATNNPVFCVPMVSTKINRGKSNATTIVHLGVELVMGIRHLRIRCVCHAGRGSSQMAHFLMAAMMIFIEVTAKIVLLGNTKIKRVNHPVSLRVQLGLVSRMNNC